MAIKSSRNKKDLNNVTAAPFSMFFQAAVTSLRPFLFRDYFSRNGFWKDFENALFSIYILIIILWVGTPEQARQLDLGMASIFQIVQKYVLTN